MAKIERIRFLRPMAGPRVDRRVGDKVWVGPDKPIDSREALRLLNAGYVEVLRGSLIEAAVAETEEPDAIETATVEPPENAATRTRRPASKKRTKRSKKK